MHAHELKLQHRFEEANPQARQPRQGPSDEQREAPCIGDEPESAAPDPGQGGHGPRRA
jgi:hypothetical protein